MLATDAAGEGVNLQNANLMVNYDLPWNPNRMEQRFDAFTASVNAKFATFGIWWQLRPVRVKYSTAC